MCHTRAQKKGKEIPPPRMDGKMASFVVCREFLSSQYTKLIHLVPSKCFAYPPNVWHTFYNVFQFLLVCARETINNMKIITRQKNYGFNLNIFKRRRISCEEKFTHTHGALCALQQRFPCPLQQAQFILKRREKMKLDFSIRIKMKSYSKAGMREGQHKNYHTVNLIF